ncbi:hypothetical protein VNI00_007046 [Paramarasmius palmivorus]|uniref:Uncharacterized protein n=1 Tax=Paramarasmius palmivorus TaxID=297713 RepID=A0AAW0D383_9AGAR
MSTPELPNDTKTLAKSPLELDPGLGSSPRRKPSGCRFVCKSVLWVFAGLFGVFVAIIFFRSGASFVNGTLRFTHASVYQNQTWEEAVKTGQRYTVARPLIDQEQMFDVGVTVWLRKTEEEMGAAGGDATERAIYQDIVFRGLKLRDKAKLAKIPLQIPPTVFRSENISTSDLSASIILMPQSPSLLDRMTNYSSWGSTPVKPVRNQSGYSLDPSPRDRAIDSFAIRLDLIQVYENQTTTMEGHVYKDDDDEPLFGTKDVPDGNEAVCYALADSGQVVLAKPRHKLQPLVVSKSHVLIADETHLFNLKSTMEKHKRFSLYGRLCREEHGTCRWLRQYSTYGHWWSLIQFETDRNDELETGGRKEPEWAYAPYLTGARRAYGPKDLVPVPVSRQACDRNRTIAASRLLAERDEDQPVNITWHLTFSAASPGKITTVEAFRDDPRSRPVGPDDDEADRLDSQIDLNMMNAFLGNSPDVHPRRKLLLGFLELVLNVVYWLLRARGSTAFISVKGTYLRALSYILPSVLRIGEDYWLSILEILSLPAFMLWAVAPVKLIWSGSRWIPSGIEVLKPNHRERATNRLDERFKPHSTLAVLVGLTLLYHFIEPESVFLITPFETPKSPTPHAWTWALVFVDPLCITGYLCQIILNYRSGVFATHQKLYVYLWATSMSCELVSHMEWILGNDRAKTGWSVRDAGWTLLVGVLVLQALSLRHESKPEAEYEHEK